MDEVWSVGPDIYKHYMSLFHGKLQIQHKQIDLLPNTNEQLYIEVQVNEIVKVVSVWNHPIEFFHNGRKEYSKGSNSQSYYHLSTALGRCGKNIQWHIHGLKMNDEKVHAVRNYAKAPLLKVSASLLIPSINSFPWADCQVFVVPDVVEEMFNFFALQSIWLGIPTLVSCQSSIGQFLLSHPCPEASRAVVNLTGNPKLDARAWMDKIDKEIIGQDANPIQWAKSMSNYFQIHEKSLESFFSDISFEHPLRNRRSSNVSTDSFSSAVGDLWSQSITSERQNLVTTQQLHENTFEFSLGSRKSNNCVQHKLTPISLYCMTCERHLCTKCKKKTHSHHRTIPIKEKQQEIMKDLKGLFESCRKRSQELEGKIQGIENGKLEIETSTAKAVKEMEEQRNIIEQEFVKVFSQQVNRIKELKEKGLGMYDTYATELQQHDRHRKDLEDSVRSLLGKKDTPNFIAEATTFLQCKQLKELPAGVENATVKLSYRHPTCKVDPQKIKNHLEDHLLGYFATDDEDRQGRDHSAQTQLGYFKRFGSVRSIGKDSIGTHMSAKSRRSIASLGIFTGTHQEDSTVEFISSTHIKIFEGSHLKIFSSVLFLENTMWICGWNKNWSLTKTIVLLNVELPEYNMLRKQKKTDPNADLPTVMAPFGDQIIFTMKGGKEVFSLNTKTGTFRLIYSRPNLKAAALCSGDYHVFLLNHSEPGFIQILNPSFEGEGKIPTRLYDVESCSIDMCVMKSSDSHQNFSTNTIVLSTSFPHSCLRAVNQQQGMLWVVDVSSALFDATFDPCSISSSLNEVIFVVDKGTDKVI